MSKENEFIIRGPELRGVPEKSVGQVFSEICATHKNKIALINPKTNESITYGELHSLAVKIAILLRGKGIKKGDVVGTFGDNTIYYPSVVLGVLYIGATLAPYNNGYTTGELEHVINLSKPTVIFCSSQKQSTLRSATNKFHYVRDIINIEPDDRIMFPTVEKLTEKITPSEIANFQCPSVGDLKNAIALIMCSSGTTGLPKGVMLSHHNVLVAIYSQIIMLELNIKHAIGLLPPFHVFGLVGLFIIFYKGITVVILEQFLPEAFLQIIQDYKIENLAVVPPMVAFLAKHPMIEKYDLSSLTRIGVGAAPLGRELEKAFLKRFPNVDAVRQGYGMTECTLGVLKVPETGQKSGSVGTAMAGAELKVIDTETNKPLGPGKPGELCIRSPVVMKGYINNPKATAETIDSEGWLHTGDIAYYDEEEWFYIIDRQKELIKYKGFQVPPAELEALLMDHPAVLDVAVIGVPNDDAGELPKAFVVKKSSVTEQEIRDFVACRVSDPKKLRGGVEFIDAIPKNPSGKILRRVLRDRKDVQSKL